MAHQLTLALLERSSSRSSSSSSSDDDHNDRRRRDQAAAAMAAGGRRERMFEKVVTPSDVGKLNRLVVPKHFAEKHLPLPGAAARAGGTVLCFHDARGGGGAVPSCWRFRYSYWSSSQSYVMTKGWSRYVRDKRLAAGDTVSFCRDGARLFIDCRRRLRRTPVPSSSSVLAAPRMMPQAQQQLVQKQHSLVVAAPRVVVADDADAVVAMQAQEARRGSCLRLFGVNLLLELQNAAEPLLLDLQL